MLLSMTIMKRYTALSIIWISERLGNINFDTDGLTVEMLVNAGNSSLELLEGVNGLEEELTLFEHRLMVILGHVSVPDDERYEQGDAILNIIYTLAATMVGADGKIEQAEIAAAEGIGKNMFANFDSVDFRASCTDIDNLPAFHDIVEILGQSLSNEHRLAIYEYLKAIAMADEELAEQEETLLNYVRTEWSLEV